MTVADHPTPADAGPDVPVARSPRSPRRIHRGRGGDPRRSGSRRPDGGPDEPDRMALGHGRPVGHPPVPRAGAQPVVARLRHRGELERRERRRRTTARCSAPERRARSSAWSPTPAAGSARSSSAASPRTSSGRPTRPPCSSGPRSSIPLISPDRWSWRSTVRRSRKRRSRSVPRGPSARHPARARHRARADARSRHLLAGRRPRVRLPRRPGRAVARRLVGGAPRPAGRRDRPPRR